MTENMLKNIFKREYLLIIHFAVFMLLIADFLHTSQKNFSISILIILIFTFIYIIWFQTVHVNNINKEIRIFGIGISNSSIFLLGIIVIKLFFQIYLYKSGFISVSADEFARGLAAFQWSKRPHVLYLDESGWMPLETYMNGLVMMFWDNVILGPRFTAFIASCILTIWFYKLTKYIFIDQLIAYFAVVMLIFHHWFVWLSGTPMLDIYFLTTIIVGVYYLVVWLKESRRGNLWTSALFFVVSSGFHIQSWAIINVINIVSLCFLIEYFRKKKFNKVIKLILFYFINNSYIIFYVLALYHKKGTIDVFAGHNAWTKIMRSGYDIGLISKILYYPYLIFKNGLFIWWLFFLFAICYLIFKKQKKEQFLLLSVLGIWLSIVSLFNAWSVPALAAPGRFSMFFILFSMPFIANGFYLLFFANKSFMINGKSNSINLIRMISIFIIGIIVFININRSLNFPIHLVSKGDTIRTGKFAEQLLKTSKEQVASMFMVEAIQWSYLSIKLTSKHPERIILDRKLNFWTMNKRVPSMLEVEDPSKIKKFLITNNVRYILIRSDNLKEMVGSYRYIFKMKNIGKWSIFKVKIDLDL